MKKVLAAVVLSIVLSAPCCALSVIVHESNLAEMDQQTITRLFLGKVKSFPDGSPARPVVQRDGMEAANRFNERVLNRSSSQLKAYWSKLLFTGRGQPPEVVADDEKMLTEVAADPASIGYISGKPGPGVRVIATYP